MKFLVTACLPSFRAGTIQSTYIHFSDSGSDLSIPLTGPETVDVWICNGKEVAADLMDRWLGQARHVPKSVLVRDAAVIPRLQEYAKGRVAEMAGFPKQVPNTSTKEWEESILRDAEMLYARARADAGTQRVNVNRMKDHTRKTTVLLVGAGIMNLMTARLLVERGYQVRVVDQGLDHRSCKPEDWTSLGVTSGGHSARMFTHTEADNYNEQGSEIYQDMQSIFRKTVRDGGWSVKLPKDFTTAEHAWVNAFECVPGWMAAAFKKNIHEVNCESGEIWKELMKTDPQLFEDVGFHKDIIRMLAALLEAPSPEEFLNTYPGFRPAAESDHLSGGITVDGFTVNTHLFVTKLMDHITALGGEFVWNCQVQGIQSNPKDAEFDENPSTCHKVEDINITVAKDRETNENILIFGGAYGYVGLDRPAPDSPELKALYDELEEVARIYFPRGYAAAKKRGPMGMYPGGHRKFCVRPFTPTGLGVFEKIPTASGGQLIITGGNNTGGFAQAPAISRAVLRSLMGEHDHIHVIFHPDRGKLPTAVTYKSRDPSPEPLLGSSVDAEARQSLKLLLLCSDGPQHRYLRYRLDQVFPGYRCIQETSDGQVRQLMDKGRIVDAGWQKYHKVRRRVFGHDSQRRAHFDHLVPQGHVSPGPDMIVDSVNCRDVWESVEKWQPELTIVSGTKYIGKKLIAHAGLMINMHTGYLPEYKGNHCIFFALYDGAVDKVASTLHQLTPSLDGGAVLDRVFCPVLPTDNEETLYTRCLEMSMDRCVDHIGRFCEGREAGVCATGGGGEDISTSGPYSGEGVVVMVDAEREWVADGNGKAGGVTQGGG